MDEWQGAVIEAANALPVGRQYAADQVGLGLAVYRTGAALSLLPETTGCASGADEDRGVFTQTQPPFDVGIIHLAGISPDEPSVRSRWPAGLRPQWILDMTHGWRWQT